MTLALDTVTPVTGIIDACDSVYGVSCIVNNGTNYVFRIYSYSSGHAQVGTDVNFPTGDTPTCIIYFGDDGSSHHWACFSSSQAKIWTIDVSDTSGTTTISVLSTTAGLLPSLSPNQKTGSAAVTTINTVSSGGASYGVPAFSLTTTVNNLNEYNPTSASKISLSATLPYLDSNDFFTCMAQKYQPDVDSYGVSGPTSGGNSHILLGTVSGTIFEIAASSSPSVVKVFTPKHRIHRQSSSYPSICGMVFIDGFLLVSDSYGLLSLYEWESGTLLQRELMGNTLSNSLNSIPTVNFASPKFLLGINSLPTVLASVNRSINSQGPIITEIDMFTTPMLQGSQYLATNTDPFSAMGGGFQISSITNNRTWWAVQPTSAKLHWITQSNVRTTSIGHISMSSGGNAMAGEVTILNDPSQPASTAFSTTFPSQGITLPVPFTNSPSNSTIYIARSGKGENAVAQMGRLG